MAGRQVAACGLLTGSMGLFCSMRSECCPDCCHSRASVAQPDRLMHESPLEPFLHCVKAASFKALAKLQGQSL